MVTNLPQCWPERALSCLVSQTQYGKAKGLKTPNFDKNRTINSNALRLTIDSIYVSLLCYVMLTVNMYEVTLESANYITALCRIQHNA
jgi:hypothetical protein